MAIAIDTSVLLDVALEEPGFFQGSKAALLRAMPEGLVICEAVLAEVVPAADGDLSVIREFLSDWSITFLPSSLESALLAGQMFSTFLKRGGKRARVLPDFLIGAHARLQASALLARDRGYYRDYFRSLNVIDPSKL